MKRIWLVFAMAVAIALTLGSLGIASAQDSTTPNSTPKDATSQDTKTQSQGASDSTSGKASPEAVSPQATTSTNNGFTLTKKVSPDTVAVGDKLTFTIKETNNSGSGLFFNKGINDILPTGVKFVSATPPSQGGSCSFDSSTRTVNCKGFSIADGDKATITVVVKAKQSGSFKNKANDTGFPGNKVTAPFTVT